MSCNAIVLQTLPPCNGAVTVRLTRSLRTTATGFIIPAGTVGRVLEYNPTTHKLMIDFGVANYAQALDPHSDAYEFVRGQNA